MLLFSEVDNRYELGQPYVTFRHPTQSQTSMPPVQLHFLSSAPPVQSSIWSLGSIPLNPATGFMIQSTIHLR